MLERCRTLANLFNQLHVPSQVLKRQLEGHHSNEQEQYMRLKCLEQIHTR